MPRSDYPQGTVPTGAGGKSLQSQHLPASLQEKRRGSQRKIQRQVCAVGHHGLRGMRAAIPQAGLVKVRAETSRVAL